MARTVTLFQFMPYGAPELQSVARPNMVRALLLSSTLCTLAVASVGLTQLIPHATSAPPISVITLTRIPAPPPMDRYAAVPPVAPAGAVHAAAGIAVPVPDALASPEASIADQDQLRVETPGLGTSDKPIVVSEPVVRETLSSGIPYFSADELPVPVFTPQPVYSDIAQQAGVTGRVVVYVLVGKDGRVRDARVDAKVHVLMLDALALDAARQWVFKPALTNNAPVEVWVALPFNFTLH